MSAITVRQALVNYFAPPAVPLLGKVYTAMPRLIDPREVQQLLLPGTPTMGAMFPFIPDRNDRRIGLGAKEVRYSADLICVFASQHKDAESAQDDVDEALDSMVALLRQDPTLGTSNWTQPVFQAGEGDEFGGPDIVVTQELPVQLKTGGTLAIWARIGLTVLEVIKEIPS